MQILCNAQDIPVPHDVSHDQNALMQQIYGVDYKSSFYKVNASYTAYFYYYVLLLLLLLFLIVFTYHSDVSE